MKNLHSINKLSNASAIEYAKGLLERCEAGLVWGVTAIEEHPGGKYSLAGSMTKSRTATAGMLLDAAIMRLTDDERT